MTPRRENRAIAIAIVVSMVTGAAIFAAGMAFARFVLGGGPAL